MTQKVKYEGKKVTVEGEEVSPFAKGLDEKELAETKNKIIAMNRGNSFGKEKLAVIPAEKPKEKQKDKTK